MGSTSLHEKDPLNAFLVFPVRISSLNSRMSILVVGMQPKYTHTQKISLTSFSSPGFVDLQTEKADLMENVGTIPFLDYKHFASRIFFPEVQ